MLKLPNLPSPIWMPITLKFSKFKIGAPDEPLSVEHLCSKLILSLEILFTFPIEKEASYP